ncbi:MAG: single-stranded DNA-binding protein [Flavipsychrobacter sp.]|nr:single-stranded DNA-binding protein [Flavipsychrobacter sp.]
MTANNHVLLIGNLGAEPKFIAHEKRPFVAFSLATQDRYKDKDGNWQNKPTVWNQVLVFNSSLIETAQKLSKGTRIKLTGSLSYRSFDAVVDGQATKKNEASVIAETIEYAPLPAATHS